MDVVQEKPVILPERGLETSGYPEEYWRSLYFFNVYRLVVAALLLTGAVFWHTSVQLGSHDRTLFLAVDVLYMLFGLACGALIRLRRRFNLQLALQVFGDIAFINLLVYASGGVTSGLGLLLLATLAGAALISRGRLTMFYAAIASIVVLLEHTYEALEFGEGVAQYVQAGFLCIGFFAVAWLAYTLARHTRVSEQLAAQREVDLANLSEVNRLVIKDMPDGVVVVDGGGVIRQINARAESMLGPASASDGLTLLDYAPVMNLHFQRWRDNPSASAEYGAAIGQEYGIRFVPVGNRRESGAVIFLEDLTRLREQARQMKLAAIGRLTANIAHEIRNPLGSISHAAELLKEEDAISGASQRLLGIIHDNTQRLNRMVNDVLGLNRGNVSQPEKIALEPFVQKFIEEFCGAESADITMFTLDIQPGLQVIFDRSHLHQVMWNLCRNAQRHCGRQTGSIRISGRRVRAGLAVELSVIDDGPGVSPTVRGELFEPFVTAAKGGTGLGLYIARDICTANAGALDYVETSSGAQFTITCKAG